MGSLQRGFFTSFVLCHVQPDVQLDIQPVLVVSNLTVNGSVCPLPPLDAHLNRSEAPILAVVVALAVDTGAGLGLLVGQDGEHAKDDGDARVELDAHEALAGGLGDVLEVHGLALDEHADGDDGVEGA